jgi:alkylation response protein AidB-like acyl-CoA dehydrogenase
VNFDRNEQQQLLAESFERFVRKHYSFQERGCILASGIGISDRVWSAFADMGLLGLSIPVEYGGFSGGADDLIDVMENIGHALVVEPYVCTVGIGARLVARAGNERQKQAILPAVVGGRMKMALAQLERGARYDLAEVRTKARREADGWVINGEKRLVVHAPNADQLIVSTRTAGNDADRDGVSLFLVDARSPGVVMKTFRTIDSLRAANVTFNNVQVGPDALLGPAGGGLPALEEAVDFATALLCAEALGAIKYANDATLEYLKTRRQFGVPIGTFQVLQHRMVDMFISYEQVKSLVYLACTKVDSTGDAEERKRIVSAAKIRTAEACRQVSQDAVQLHGAMGLADELKISHTFRRLTMIAQEFGDIDHHLERFSL